jgi:hypothetical protein
MSSIPISQNYFNKSAPYYMTIQGDITTNEITVNGVLNVNDGEVNILDSNVVLTGGNVDISGGDITLSSGNIVVNGDITSLNGALTVTSASGSVITSGDNNKNGISIESEYVPSAGNYEYVVLKAVDVSNNPLTALRVTHEHNSPASNAYIYLNDASNEIYGSINLSTAQAPSGGGLQLISQNNSVVTVSDNVGISSFNGTVNVGTSENNNPLVNIVGNANSGRVYDTYFNPPSAIVQQLRFLTDTPVNVSTTGAFTPFPGLTIPCVSGKIYRISVYFNMNSQGASGANVGLMFQANNVGQIFEIANFKESVINGGLSLSNTIEYLVPPNANNIVLGVQADSTTIGPISCVIYSLVVTQLN